jgi:LacI family transcriptional regulator, repressor for deo operon, udp, cdd, tsx, nupC, and nupG
MPFESGDGAGTATMKDVARLAGVSTATVSRTLIKPELVSTRTRERVMKAVAEAGYTPNSLARNLRKMQTRSIIVVVQDITNPFYPEILRGAEQTAQAFGYTVLMGNTDNDPVRERAYLELVQSRRADGMILLTGRLPAQGTDSVAVERERLPPLVFACEHLPDLGLPTVRIDNAEAARMAMRHLFELGHERIAHIAGPLNRIISVDRLAGYREALTERGLPPEPALVADGDFTFNSGVEAASRLLALAHRPTAIFAANDESAIGAIQAIKSQGLSVPGDISVIGFDNILFAAATDPALTTIGQPRQEIGRRAMAIMLDLLDGKSPPLGDVILPVELVIRRSTGPRPLA